MDRASGRGGGQFVLFYIEDRAYGFDIEIVKEVNTNTDITPVPRTKPHIRGLVNIRGQVVLVMDIAVILGRPARPITAESRVIIMKTAQELGRVAGAVPELDLALFGDKPLCFLVDRVGDVATANADEIEPPPSHLSDVKIRYVKGVLNRGGDLVVALNAAEFIAADAGIRGEGGK